MKFPSFYFPWLQEGNPTGTVDTFPELKNTYETTVAGLYCVGDLTGIPLIKLAAESGYDCVERLNADERFAEERSRNTGTNVYDLVIVGGGPAGISACLHAAELGMRHVVIESASCFNTIANFPAGKPIYVTPEEPPMKSRLAFSDGTKESLLEELHAAVQGAELPLHEGETVTKILQKEQVFHIESDRATYRALRVIVAIGKSGNARRLHVPGEDKPQVYTRLIDPGEHSNQAVLVVGGGDSALEAANALAERGNRVVLSYRKASFSRPKEQNITAFNRFVNNGTIRPIFSSTVREIRDTEVVLDTGDGEVTIAADAVFVLIGTEFPIRFFKRSGIRMAGERNAFWWLSLTAMVSFFVMLYFGKAGVARNLFGDAESIGERIVSYLTGPLSVSATWSLVGYSWYGSLNFYLGWLGSLVFLVSGVVLLGGVIRNPQRFLDTPWNRIKYGYITPAAAVFLWVYFSAILGQNAGWVESPTYWYSLLYTTTIILFGIRRMQVRPTGYIIRQTCVLMGIQVFFLFLLPFYLYDSVITRLVPANGYVLREMFPEGKWSSFGFVLFWPLNINNFGTSSFWTWFPFVQTFLILFFLVYRWGKGAYCGWICSCGAMAETLGDEYREQSPHGRVAKRLDSVGQVVLWFAVLATAAHIGARALEAGTRAADAMWGIYKISIDVFFAGVLGLGVYFFLGGRIWCRYGCPLAALMHIYARFSPYRIMADKKRCISCNICTRVCHMGIDVMGYANKGIPMNDVECVRCSACIVNCPMQVLTFGDVGETDVHNTGYRSRYFPLKRGWEAGLPDGDLAMRLEDEQKKHPEVSSGGQR